ncbi:ABC transporter permease [Gottschalkiaceae bacterium SANA]|nr:ABC transporter permease [Gottschalkiaceae bacterium SANA]
MKQLRIKAVFILAGGLIWQGIYLSGVYSPLLFPSLGTICTALGRDIVEGALVDQFLYSMRLVIEGLALSLVLGLGIALFARSYSMFRSGVNLLISIAHPLPGVVLLPLVILWAGIGEGAVLFIIVHSVLWPFLVSFFSALDHLPQTQQEVADNYEIFGWRRLIWVDLPGSFPGFLSGLKIGWSRAWRALISAEMIFGATSGSGGIGWYLFQKRVFMDTAGLFAGLLVIMLIGVLIEGLFFRWVERKTVLRWGMER